MTFIASGGIVVDAPPPPPPPPLGAFPRIGITWQGNQGAFDEHARIEHLLAMAEYIVIAPLQSQYSGYRTPMLAALARNPDLLVAVYTHADKQQPGPDDTKITVLESFDNPNQGGADLANDGIVRKANGDIVFINTLHHANVSEEPAPFTGTPASGDSDTTKARTGEIPRDYCVRWDFYHLMNGITDFSNGIMLDEANIDDILPQDHDYDNNGTNGDYPDAVWRGAIVHFLKLFGGDNMEGAGDTTPTRGDGVNPGARSNGEPWLNHASDPFVGLNCIDINSSGGLSNNGIIEVLAWLNGGSAPPIIAEYDQQIHYNLVEFGFGGRTDGSGGAWFGGISHDGVNIANGAGNSSCDMVFGMAFLSERHLVVHSAVTRKIQKIECRATQFWIGTHSFCLMCLTDFVGAYRDFNGFATGEGFIPYELDEHVGEDISLLTADQIFARKGWMGQEVTAAWPNIIKTDGVTITSDGLSDSINDSGAVFVRRFDNALILCIPGRTHYKNKSGIPARYAMNEVVTVDMTLFPPGIGKKWQRIDGAQRTDWNDGSDVGSSITLGTTVEDVRDNSIVLKLVDV